MKKTFSLFIALWTASLLTSMAAVNIIPKPSSVVERQGTFVLKDGLTIGYNDPSLAPAANYLQEMLTRATGLRIKTGKKGKIQLNLVNNAQSSMLNAQSLEEDYEFVSDPTGVLITATTYRGIINGIATLRQLLPNEIESFHNFTISQFHNSNSQISKSANSQIAQWSLPAVAIKDSPTFHWRGLMLDPVRHFYSVEETKALLDQMALYKFNKFHWHLSDEQAVRVEIKGYPELSADSFEYRTFNSHDRRCLERAGKENNPDLCLPWKYFKTINGKEMYGGYYTQDEIRDVVAYAAVRGIDVIPEIDMPGHNHAACRIYPWLSCTQDGVEPLCLGRNTTIEFAKRVYDEIFELFPYEYVSIGGDEVNRGRWSECDECKRRIREEGLKDVSELQAWFTKLMEKYFNAHGRRILGWDEILEGGLSKTATVHWWRGDHADVAQRSTAMGNEVVLCPTTYCYFDYGQDDKTLRRLYDGDIVPTDLSAEQLKLVKGMQANIWGEYIPSEARMQWMVFPRALALAEKAWTPRSEQHWDDFLPRLEQHLKRLDVMGINYRPLHTNRP